ncbi:hypothetical protein ACINNAV18_3072 [Acinetobacter baumannii Naval-18]|nr:hypothetical protein ACINNAV18_3072 [Acinetobacter baumannii Naval-18]ETR89712.1 hypothetical protein M212_1312 [Acinetobacter baumannii CI79]
MAIAVIAGINFIIHNDFDIYKIFLNFTLLFGFVTFDKTFLMVALLLGIGAWLFKSMLKIKLCD